MATALGRLGKILDRVQQVLNSAAAASPGPFTEGQLIIWANECTANLAEADMWRKTGDLDLVADTASYDLTATFTDIVHPTNVRVYLDGVKYPMQCFPTWDAFENANTVVTSGSTVYHYYVENGTTLYVWPEPDSAVSPGLNIRYSYLPTDFDADGSSSYTPACNKVYDLVYDHYICWQACLKSDKPTARDRAPHFMTQFLLARERALTGQHHKPLRLRPPG